MSILSWDDFEDDSQKPAAPDNSLRPITQEKRLIRRMYLLRSHHAERAAPQSAGTHSVRST
ncbi:hypothetical protein, partial [Staphylococcus aureus]|uniref:hypothetical protein n=1 Tax=Staphylococcus aureus TaxID=1280 RepID=UPI001C82D49B